MNIEMKQISKAFHGNQVLRQVKFSLVEGEIHALMGENGAGKSTLMKILTGMYAQDEGEILIDGKQRTFKNPKDAERNGISFIHQELNILPYLTVAENLFLGRELKSGPLGVMKTKEMNRITAEKMASLGIPLDPKELAENLSVGQQQMIEIAKALMTDAKVIIMDEPTAALTEREIQTLFNVMRKLKASGVSIVYISHRMEEIFAMCDRITILRDGTYVDTKQIVDTSFDDVVRMMVGRSIGERFPRRTSTPGEVFLEAEHLTSRKFNKVSFTVRRGEIFGFAGLMGAGRTEIMNAIFGLEPTTGGTLKIGGIPVRVKSPHDAIKRQIGYITEDRKTKGLLLDFSINDNIALTNFGRLSNGGVINSAKEKELIDRLMQQLNVKASGSAQHVRYLSGGNQQKVVIAKWLGTEPQLLILDEPTRGVDVGAKKEIYSIMNQLTEQGVAIIMVSSELPEVLGMSDRIAVVHEGTVKGILSREEATQESIMSLATGGK
ncbi:sugar ABC transporter ATP-binding protein [Paenibacillus selenitireducens]|uniref:Sugar ABC transporter ATP-binding protein n=1 Tax=Paenibacillus selenitireducens TaxID=1324314 RepID=A0A1T2WZ94_9BACL|nr:sugar ABC transporter ATP-binding protein [Paenibacillus selenitireducens]OPA72947.1 sugar ABC transporter ATP-binding protein [Paenibacillus selenitireducens]